MNNIHFTEQAIKYIEEVCDEQHTLIISLFYDYIDYALVPYQSITDDPRHVYYTLNNNLDVIVMEDAAAMIQSIDVEKTDIGLQLNIAKKRPIEHVNISFDF